MMLYLLVNSLIEKAKENYYKEALIDANAKETFRTLGKILNQNVRAVPSFDTPEALSNKFADFFNDKVEKIRLDIDRDTVDSVNDADIGSVVQANSSDLETHWNSKSSMKVKSMRLLLIVQTNHATLIAYLPGYLNVTLMLFYHISHVS